MAVGTFSGTPRTEWLNVPADDARDMKLLEDFSYTDASGKQWDAPAGSIINGASIPASLWATVGSPFTGSYRNGSIIHDVACVRAHSKAERKAADLMFYEACLAGGCARDQANDLYIGVRIGAWWSPPAPQLESVPLANRAPERTSADAVKAFREVRKKLGDRKDVAKPAEIEKLVEEEVKKLESDEKPVRKKSTGRKTPAKKSHHKSTRGKARSK